MQKFCSECEFQIHPRQPVVILITLKDCFERPHTKNMSIFHAECYQHPTILIPLGDCNGVEKTPPAADGSPPRSTES